MLDVILARRHGHFLSKQANFADSILSRFFRLNSVFQCKLLSEAQQHLCASQQGILSTDCCYTITAQIPDLIVRLHTTLCEDSKLHELRDEQQICDGV